MRAGQRTTPASAQGAEGEVKGDDAAGRAERDAGFEGEQPRPGADMDLALLGTASENVPAQRVAAAAYERVFTVPAYVRGV